MKYLDEHPHWFRYDKQHTPAWESRDGLYVYWQRDWGHYVVRPTTELTTQHYFTVEISRSRTYYSFVRPYERESDLPAAAYLALIRCIKEANHLQPHFSLPYYIPETILWQNSTRKSKFPPNHPWGKNT